MLFEEARLGTIISSLIAAIAGLTWLYLSARKAPG
jgi:Na+/H+ antiporter NhaA